MGSDEADGAGDEDGEARRGALESRAADPFLPMVAAPGVAAEGAAGRGGGGGGRRGEEEEADDEDQEQGGA